MDSNDTPTYAEVKFFVGEDVVSEKRYDLYKTKLGVHNSDMWYDISCHTGNDFTLAGKVEDWAKDAAIGSTYVADPVSIRIVK